METERPDSHIDVWLSVPNSQPNLALTTSPPLPREDARATPELKWACVSVPMPNHRNVIDSTNKTAENGQEKRMSDMALPLKDWFLKTYWSFVMSQS